MTPNSGSFRSPITLSLEGLQARWRDLNVRFFAGLLPPISIDWSRRLTSSVGMFTSRGGPRLSHLAATGPRGIRLSLPILERLADRTPYAEQELHNILAHEMIHQWQFDVLKRRPDHGFDFLRKMTEMNRTGEVAITIQHSLRNEVLSLARFAWRCKNCGHIYRRQRKTISPALHHCGTCSGPLQELMPLASSPLYRGSHRKELPPRYPGRPLRQNIRRKPYKQLSLPL